jgi:3-dehydroquinate synthase
MRAGMVEIIKMSFLATSDLKKFLTENNEQQLIREAVRTKMEICEKDLEDQGRRRLLNLGHTFGHILESVSNYEINHAEAVAIGIRAAAAFSRDLKLISQQKFSRINAFLDQFDLPVYFSGKYRDPIETKGVEILHQDKKADSKINLILFQEDQGLTIYRTDDRHALIKTLLRFAREA